MTVYKQPAIHKNYRASSGQLLIEVLISTLVLVIITSGVVAGVIVGVRNAAYARQRTLATYYAQREIEIAKQSIKSNWRFPSGVNYPVSVTYPINGITVTLTIGCFINTIQTNPNLCNPPVVSLQATASWNRAGAGTESQVILSTIMVKDNR